MSILKSTNSGLSNIELTVDVVKSFGWVVASEKTWYQHKQNHLVKCTQIFMNNEDIYLPLYFHFDNNKLTEVYVGFKFLGDRELFGITHSSSEQRIIKTAKDLIDCMNFIKQVDECSDKIKSFWFNNIMKFEDPYKNLYRK